METIKGSRYIFAGTDLGRIRNRNEIRVVENMQEVLGEYPDFYPDVIDIQDIYALALNALPPRYTQQFSVVLREPVTDDDVRQAIRRALVKVMNNPTEQSDNSGPIQW